MGDAVDHETAHAADALTTVVVKGDGLLVRVRELLIEHVEHLQERHVRGHAINVILGHRTPCFGAGLAPDAQLEFHL